MKRWKTDECGHSGPTARVKRHDTDQSHAPLFMQVKGLGTWRDAVLSPDAIKMPCTRLAWQPRGDRGDAGSDSDIMHESWEGY